MVLIVSIGVNNHIGIQPDARVQPSHKGSRKPLILHQTDDVIHSMLSRHVHSVVAAAVIYDQPLNLIETLY